MKQFFPILEWLPKYQKSWLSGDLSAGLTVGIMLIPQGMAYAMIAGLPAVYGLYAALFPQVIYAIFGTSRQLAVGPVAMDSLLVASGLLAFAKTGSEEFILLAIVLAFMMGMFQLLLGIIRMGFLVNFLSKPVISGFTSAAAIIIALSQLKHLIGVNIPRNNKIHLLLNDAFLAMDQIHWITLGIGLISIIVIKVLKKMLPKIPAALVVVVLGTSIVALLEMDSHGVKIVGEIPKGFPSFAFPDLYNAPILDLIPIALTLSVIAFMEAFSVAKAIEEKHDDYEVDANKELIALGMSNIIGSLFQSYPTTGGFSRTAVSDQAGAKTGMYSIVSAFVVGLTLLFFTPLFYFLPNAVLAAIIMVAVFGLIDIKLPKYLWKHNKEEFFLLLITFGVTLSVGIVSGILVGVVVSLLLLVYRTSRPHMATLVRIGDTAIYRNKNRFENAVDRPDVLVVRFDSQIYFGNQQFFKSELLKRIHEKGNDLRLVVLSAESVNYIDATGIHMLKQLVDELGNRNIRFYVSGVIGPVRDIINTTDLKEAISENVQFLNCQDAINYFECGECVDYAHKNISTQCKGDFKLESV
ncbi:MAG: solute carrier family 26 protein [Crocinitomicaceae bacterium]